MLDSASQLADGNMLYRHVCAINMLGTALGNQVYLGREAESNVVKSLKA
ncbi:hypothetical protein [Eggerthella guodeyinii]|nr:hypothetical protein [Eggerthella guodeyinii]